MVVDTVEVTLPLSVEDEGLVECISSLIPIYLLGCGTLVLFDNCVTVDTLSSPIVQYQSSMYFGLFEVQNVREVEEFM